MIEWIKKSVSILLIIFLCTSIFSIPALAGDTQYTITLDNSHLSGAAASLSTPTVTNGGSVTLTISPNAGTIFKTAPSLEIHYADASAGSCNEGQMVSKADGSYTCEITNIKGSGLTIYVIGSTTAVYSISLDTSALGNAEATLAKTSGIEDGETVEVVVTPKSGYVFSTAPVISVTSPSWVASGGFMENDNGGYYCYVYVRTNTVVTISGTAEIPSTPEIPPTSQTPSTPEIPPTSQTPSTPEPHTHSFAAEWSKDASGHWHACECGEKADFAPHTSSGAASATAAEVCTVCGYEIAPKLTGYTITFDARDGSISPATATVKPGTKIYDMNSAYKPVRGGYEFVGWSLENDGIADSSNALITGDCTLYAVWQQYIPGYNDYYDPEPPLTVIIDGVRVGVDYSDGVVSIVNRDDIADGSISEVDMGVVSSTASLTDKQAIELIEEWIDSCKSYANPDKIKNYIRPKLKDYSLADLEVIERNIERAVYPNDFIWDTVNEEIQSREATDLVIAPRYIDSTSDFKVITGQGLGVTYSDDAVKALLDSLDDDSNIKVETKFEKAEITLDDARIIVAEWREIINTPEGEAQIKNAFTKYSIYELALLLQVIDRDEKLYWLVYEEREKKKEQAWAKDNEEPLAKFSVDTYAVKANGEQTYIPVKNSMQYAIPVDPSSIPENANLALYRVNEDGTRTKQQIISIENDKVIGQSDGNSDYVLVYTVGDSGDSMPWLLPCLAGIGVVVVVVFGCLFARKYKKGKTQKTDDE